MSSYKMLKNKTEIIYDSTQYFCYLSFSFFYYHNGTFFDSEFHSSSLAVDSNSLN